MDCVVLASFMAQGRGIKFFENSNCIVICYNYDCGTFRVGVEDIQCLPPLDLASPAT